jgi:hypothetical protein
MTQEELKAFKDMQNCCLKLWRTYDNTFGYVDEKVGCIEKIENVKDNFMYMYAMLDPFNQVKVYAQLQPETQKEVDDRLGKGYADNASRILKDMFGE